MKWINIQYSAVVDIFYLNEGTWCVGVLEDRDIDGNLETDYCICIFKIFICMARYQNIQTDYCICKDLVFNPTFSPRRFLMFSDSLQVVIGQLDNMSII